MDKTNSKDEMRAAGKKRLEQFRKTRQQKSSTGKAAETGTGKGNNSEAQEQQDVGDPAPVATSDVSLPPMDTEMFRCEPRDVPTQSGHEGMTEGLSRDEQVEAHSEEHDKDCNSLKLHLDESIHLKDSLVKEIQELRSQLSSTQGSLQDKVTECDERQAVISANAVAAAQRTAEDKAQLDDLTRKLDMSHEEGAKLRIMVQASNDEAEQLRLDLCVCKQQLESSYEEKAEACTKASKLEAELHNSVEENQLLGRELAVTKERFLEMEHSKSLLCSSLENMKQELLKFQEAASIQADDLAKSHVHVTSLEQANSRLSDELEAASYQFEHLQQEHTEMTREKAAMETQLHLLKQQLSETEGIKSLITYELASVRGNLSNELQDKAQLSAELERAQVSLKDQTDKNKELVTEVEDLRVQRAAIVQEVIACKQSLAEVTDSKSLMEKELEHRMQESVSEGARMETLSGENQSLLSEKTLLAGQLQAAQAQIFDLQEAKKLLTAEVSRLLSELEVRDVALSKLEEETGCRGSNLQLLTLQLKDLSDERDRLMCELLKVERVIEELKDENSNLRGQFAAARSACDGVVQTKAELEEELAGLHRQLLATIEARDGLQRQTEAMGQNRAHWIAELDSLCNEFRELNYGDDNQSNTVRVQARESLDNENKAFQDLRQHMLELISKQHEERDEFRAKIQYLEGQIQDQNAREAACTTRLKDHIQRTESNSLELEQAVRQVLPSESLDASPSAKSADASVRLASCVGKLIQEFETKALQFDHVDLESDPPVRAGSVQLSELFCQVTALRESVDSLKRERDASINAEQNCRLELEAALRRLQEVDQERSQLAENLNVENQHSAISEDYKALLEQSVRERGRVQSEKDSIQERLDAMQLTCQEQDEKIKSFVKTLETVEGTVLLWCQQLVGKVDTAPEVFNGGSSGAECRLHALLGIIKQMCDSNLASRNEDPQRLVRAADDQSRTWQLENNALVTSNEHLQSELVDCRGQIQGLTVENSNLERKVRTVAEEYKAFQVQSATQISQLLSDKKAIQEELEDVQLKRQEQDDRLKSSLKTLENMEARVSAVCQELVAQLREAPKFLTNGSSVAEYGIDALHAVVKQICEWNGSLEEQLTQATLRNEELQSMARLSGEQTRTLRLEKDEIVTSRERLQAELVDLKGQIHGLELSMTAKGALDMAFVEMQVAFRQELLHILDMLHFHNLPVQDGTQLDTGCTAEFPGKSDEIKGLLIQIKSRSEFAAQQVKHTVNLQAEVENLQRKFAAAVEQVQSLEVELEAATTSLSTIEQQLQKATSLASVMVHFQRAKLPDDLTGKNLLSQAEWVTSFLEVVQEGSEAMSRELENAKEIANLVTLQLENAHEREKVLTTEFEVERGSMRNELQDSKRAMAVLAEEASQAAFTEVGLRDQLVLAAEKLDAEIARRDKMCSDLEAFFANTVVVLPRSSSTEVLGSIVSFPTTFDTLSNLIIRVYEDMMEQHEELKRKVLVQIQQLTEFESRQQACDQFVKSLQKAIDDKDNEISDLTARLEEAATTMAHQEEEISGFSQQSQKMRNSLDEAESERSSLRAQVTEMEHKISGTREKLSMAVRKGKALKLEYDNLQRTVAAKDAQMDNLVTRHVVELQSKDVSLRELNLKIKVLSEEKQALLLENRAIALQLSEQTAAAQALLEENTVLRVSKGESEQDVEKLSTSLAARIAELDVARSEADNYSSEIIELRALSEIQHNELARLKTETLLKHQTNDEVQFLRASLSMVLDVLNSSVAELNLLQAEKGTINDQSASQAQPLPSGNVPLVDNSLTKKCQELVEVVHAISRSAQQAKTVRERELTIHQEDLKKRHSEIVGLQSQLSALERQLSDNKRVTADLGEERDQLQQVLQDVQILSKKALGEKERECGNIRQRLAQSEDALKSLLSKKEMDEVKMLALESRNVELDKELQTLRSTLQIAEGKATEDAKSLRNAQEDLAALHELLSSKDEDLEAHILALSEAESQNDTLSQRVKELEAVLREKQASLQSLEASRSKAISKLNTNYKNLNVLLHQSEELVALLGSLQTDLEKRDAEIARLVGELDKHQSQVQALRAGQNLRLEQLQGELVGMLSKAQERLGVSGAQVNLTSPSMHSMKSDEQDIQPDLSELQSFLETVSAQMEGWRVQMTKKDGQLQDLRTELQVLAAEKAALEGVLQTKEPQQSPSLTMDDLQSLEMDDLGQRNKRVPAGNAAAAHVRGPRKVPPSDVIVEVDLEEQLLDNFDDKGHDYKSLAKARYTPRAMRSIAERLDGLCVAGGRLLMKQPSVRLGLIIYWLFIHSWILLTFL